MRNLARYPLTLDEILKILADQAKAIESEQRIGDIQPAGATGRSDNAYTGRVRHMEGQ